MGRFGTSKPTRRRLSHRATTCGEWIFGRRAPIAFGPRVSLFDDDDDGFQPLPAEIVFVSLDIQRVMRERVNRNAEVLLSLSPRQFEEFVAEVLHRLGYKVELTKRTRDGEYDISAVKAAEIASRLLIECKRYDPSRLVDIGLVRNLHSVKIDNGATKGILATTSYFTGPAEEYIDDHFWELEGRDHQGILTWARQVIEIGKASDGLRQNSDLWLP